MKLGRGGIQWLLIGGILMVSAGCDRQTDDPPVRAVRAMQVGDVERLSRAVFPGRALPNEEVNLSFRVGGELVARPVSFGDSVTRGQLLARIDPRDFEIQVRTYRGELDATRANHEQQKIELEGLRELRAQGAATQLEVDRVRTRADELAGRVQMVEAALDDAKNRLADTELKAPFDGVVAATYVEAFQTIQPREPVMRILDTSRIKVQVDIPEQLMYAVPYVTGTHCTFDAYPDVVIPAEVREIGTEASAVTRTYPVTLIMDPPDHVQILPGMAATVRVRAVLPADEAQRGIEVPLGAVGQDSESAWVWRIDPEHNTVHRREVEIRALTSRGVRVHGITQGEWIATAGVHTLREGQTVRLDEDPALPIDEAGSER